jgi:DNA polymerase-1
MNQLLLIDGHNLLCKAFYGLPERMLPNGKPIQGVIGFLGMMIKIIKIFKPTHILVVFDPEETPSRVSIYEKYKSNRQDSSKLPEKENPFSQLAGIKTALDKLGIKYLEQPGYEADDMIASLTTRAKGEVIIVSTDTDFLQLINTRISVFKYQGNKSILFDEAMVQERYGVHPSRFIEYKALVGDKSDNIAGVKGIGPKTAVKVINGERILSVAEREIFDRNRNIIALNRRIKSSYTLHELSFNRSLESFKMGEFLNKCRIFNT